MIFEGQPESLKRRYVGAAFGILAHWRDEAAHGVVSEISEIDAFRALTLPVRLAQFLHSHWAEIGRWREPPEATRDGTALSEMRHAAMTSVAALP